jgi:predicted DNA-binding transcriptional regulator AlpA
MLESNPASDRICSGDKPARPLQGLVFKSLKMKAESVSSKSSNALLFTCDPESFWNEVRQIIKEELSELSGNRESNGTQEASVGNQTLYKIKDLCRIFSVSKPTIYEWIRLGKLKPRRIKRRVFFLEKDLKSLLEYS